MEQGHAGQSLADLVRLQVEAEDAVAELDAALQLAKNRLRELSEEAIPAYMQDHDLEYARLEDGTRIDVREAIRASIAVEDRNAVHAELERQGHGGVVKRRVAVNIGAGDDASEAAAVRALEAAGFAASREVKVEPATLSALVRELLADGRPVPEGIKVFRQKAARIARPS